MSHAALAAQPVTRLPGTQEAAALQWGGFPGAAPPSVRAERPVPSWAVGAGFAQELAPGSPLWPREQTAGPVWRETSLVWGFGGGAASDFFPTFLTY